MNELNRILSNLISYRPIIFNKKCGMLSTNTQARRLGCLIFIIGQIQKGRRVEQLLYELNVNEIKKLRDNLISNGYHTGFITEKKSSIRHYTEFAYDIKMITRQGAVLQLTNTGVFLVNCILPNIEKPYPLKITTKLFLLYQILKTDFFGIITIFQLLLTKIESVSELKKQYHEKAKSIFKNVASSKGNFVLKRIAQDRMLELFKWSNPESYSDHLVSSRLNWLEDLDILDFNKKEGIVSIKSDNFYWIKKICKTIQPRERDISYSVYCYYNASCNRKSLTEYSYLSEDILFKILEEAFNKLSPKTNLQKIRTDQLSLFVLTHYTEFFQFIFKDNQIKNTPNETVFISNGYLYRFHFASRHTQSYVTRQEV